MTCLSHSKGLVFLDSLLLTYSLSAAVHAGRQAYSPRFISFFLRSAPVAPCKYPMEKSVPFLASQSPVSFKPQCAPGTRTPYQHWNPSAAGIALHYATTCYMLRRCLDRAFLTIPTLLRHYSAFYFPGSSQYIDAHMPRKIIYLLDGYYPKAALRDYHMAGVDAHKVAVLDRAARKHGSELGLATFEHYLRGRVEAPTSARDFQRVAPFKDYDSELTLTRVVNLVNVGAHEPPHLRLLSLVLA